MKAPCKDRNRSLLFTTLCLAGALLFPRVVHGEEPEEEVEPVFADFQESFPGNHALSPWGVNGHFMPLLPGFKLLLQGEDEDGEKETLLITVLRRTKRVDGQWCAVVREQEWAGCELKEISWNYMAISRAHKGVFYFGEDVDIFEDDGTVVHDGAWLAGEDGKKAGLLMPGYPLVGSRYYQEFAPDVALDRAEHLSVTEALATPAGVFENCLFVEESSPLEPDHFSYKWYAPGIGLVKDNHLELVAYGFHVQVPELECEEEEEGEE